jgi:hypothetical protein
VVAEPDSPVGGVVVGVLVSPARSCCVSPDAGFDEVETGSPLAGFDVVVETDSPACSFGDSLADGGLDGVVTVAGAIAAS